MHCIPRARRRESRCTDESRLELSSNIEASRRDSAPFRARRRATALAYRIAADGRGNERIAPSYTTAAAPRARRRKGGGMSPGEQVKNGRTCRCISFIRACRLYHLAASLGLYLESDRLTHFCRGAVTDRWRPARETTRGEKPSLSRIPVSSVSPLLSLLGPSAAVSATPCRFGGTEASRPVSVGQRNSASLLLKERIVATVTLAVLVDSRSSRCPRTTRAA